ncbi:UvrD-helicase domain-containing protein [Streptomyces sp. NPDC059743]|uniref:UvrD-helicase domain-containing protein n=1 Tax=Streptomyces sp. NPDC059743 TaxID=3346928 RepID=UPI0036489A73
MSWAPPQRSAPGLRATEEQEAAVETFLSLQHLALQAGAGTGKTTTLTLLAKADRRRGRYLSFNKSIATDAAQKFPPSVACRTAHSLAYEAVGHSYDQRLRAPRKPAWKAGAALGIAPRMQVRIGDRTVTNKVLSYAVVRTVRRFCQSADTVLRPHHVPWLRGLVVEDLHHQLVKIVLPYAHKAWEDLQSPTGGAMRLEHDHYFKMWAMEQPLIRGDYLLLDEAQDTNPVLEEVFNAQRTHAQLVMVGDSAQAIYGWRGARDVMAGFDGEQLALSQSFRFGSVLAQEANRWLTVVESPIRLVGAPSLTTTIGPSDTADAILCRTNVGAMVAILRLLADNRRVALVGGGKALEDLAVAAGQLKAGRRATHPELVLFSTWGELQEYAEFDPSGQDLLPLVEIIDEHGVEAILAAVRRLSEEHDAEIVVSTAHKAEGREWPCVQIAPDFEPPPGDETDTQGQLIPQPLDQDEARLAYVAVTRARHHLDPGGLAWFDRHPDAPAREHSGANTPAMPWPPKTANHPTPEVSPWDRLGPLP